MQPRKMAKFSLSRNLISDSAVDGDAVAEFTEDFLRPSCEVASFAMFSADGQMSRLRRDINFPSALLQSNRCDDWIVRLVQMGSLTMAIAKDMFNMDF